jgi:hypothetical protein
MADEKASARKVKAEMASKHSVRVFKGYTIHHSVGLVRSLMTNFHNVRVLS